MQILHGIIIRNGLKKNDASWRKRVIHWKKSFDRHDIKADVLTANPCNPNKIDTYSSTKNEEIIYLLPFKLPYFLGYFLSPFLLFAALIKRRPNFILLANGGFIELFTIPIYCKFAHIPLLVDMVDTIGRSFKINKNLYDYIIIINKKLFDYFVVKHSNEIFTISSSLYNYYKNKYPNNKVTMSIPTSVDFEKFEILSDLKATDVLGDKYLSFDSDTKLIFFYAGTAKRLNGINFFLHALDVLASEIVFDFNVCFAIIDENISDLKELINKYSISDKCLLFDPVDQNLLPVLLLRADILFIPEQGKETANSGFPGKTAEYLYSGTPIITTVFSDLSLYLKNGYNSFITPIGDLDLYISNLKKLVCDSSLRKEIGNRGKQCAIDEFSVKDYARPYIKSLKKYYEF